MEPALACEAFRDGVAGQPASTLSAFGFVLAGVAVLAGYRAPGAARWPYGLLVAAVGVGSVIQHGPHPPWQAYAHDLTLAAVLAYLAADAARDLAGRRAWPRTRQWLPAGTAGRPAAGPPGWWWLLPTVAMVPAVAAGAQYSTLAQAALAAAAVGLQLWRAWRRPGLRRTLLLALAVLAAGALVGNLGDRTGLCQPETLLQGHAVWHLLAAAALWLLAPTVGAAAAGTAGAEQPGDGAPASVRPGGPDPAGADAPRSQ